MSRQTLLPYLLVGAGGFIGAIARFAVSRWFIGVWPTAFPLGTFVINVSGSFLLGVLATLTTSRAAPNGDQLRLALGVGFLGAFTTFSTFEFETHSLLDEGASFTGLTYVFLSLVLGLMAVRLGIMTVRAWWP